MVYVVSCNPALPEIVTAALKTSAVSHFHDGAAFIGKLVRDQREICVIVDLTTIPDAERLISFIQSSPSLLHLPIIAIGTPKNFEALPDGVESSLNGVIIAPFTAGQIAMVVAAVCGEK